MQDFPFHQVHMVLDDLCFWKPTEKTISNWMCVFSIFIMGITGYTVYTEIFSGALYNWDGTAVADKVYFADGYFDPDRMLNTLENYYKSSMEMGFSAARVIGEMTSDVQTVPGGERLLEYESRVSLLVKKTPVTAICQYDAKQFDGATILDVLKVHPQMIVNGAVVQNPFYIEPEEYLASIG